MLALVMMVVAYLVGSVSSAILVSKYMGLTDPRTEGSKNPGTSNVLRISGKKAAIFVLLGDVLKGFIVVLLARLMGVSGMGLGLVALAAVVGHIFPLYYSFKGGKGVATAFGTVLVLSPWVGIVAFVVWALVALISKYSSLASLTAVVLATILLLFVHLNYFLPVAVMAILIIWSHWENIQRLQNGTENKFQL